MTDFENFTFQPTAANIRDFFRHQLWLNSNGLFGRRLVLQNVYLGQRDLNGVDFSRAVLAYVQFDGSSLKHSRWVGAALHHVSFLRCDMEGADFTSAQLNNPSFAGADISGACFNDIDGALAPISNDAEPHLNVLLP